MILRLHSESLANFSNSKAPRCFLTVLGLVLEDWLVSLHALALEQEWRVSHLTRFAASPWRRVQGFQCTGIVNQCYILCKLSKPCRHARVSDIVTGHRTLALVIT
eukprot:g37410.t1